MLKNGLSNIIGAIIRLAISVITVPLLIRFLGLETYGLWTLISTAIAIISLAEGGLSVSATVFLSHDLDKGDNEALSETLTTITTFIFILATIASVSMCVCANLTIDLFGSMSIDRRSIGIAGIQIASVAVWAKLFQQVMMGVEQACQRYQEMNILNVLQSTIINIGILTIAYFGGNLIQLMQWTVLVTALASIGHIVICYESLKNIDLRIKWNIKRSLEILKYSSLTWTATIGTVLFSQFDRVIVSNLLGINALGIYAAITNVASQINVLSALPIQPLVPFISRSWNNENRDLSVITKKIHQVVRTNSVLSLGLGLIFFVLALPVMQYLLKRIPSHQEILEFRSAVIIYSIYSLNAVGYYVLLATNGAKLCTIIVTVSGVISLMFILLGAASQGVLGAIAGNAGYMLTISLIAVGMNRIEIQRSVWIKWFWIPMLWFVLSILASMNINSDLAIQVPLLVTQLITISSWLLVLQIKDLNHAT